jgi:hypothetical protein
VTTASPRGERAVLRLVFSWANLLGTALLLIGGLAAVTDSKPGAYLMITGLAMIVLTHLVVGTLGYLDVMSRPWPRVQPLDNEDEW